MLWWDGERTWAGFGCLFCYWAENNVSLIEGESDLKEERLKIHIVIGPTSPLPNAAGTRISFILLTFYCLLNLSYIWTVLNLADKGWMLLPLESILQFPQGALSPGVVYARGGNSPIPLFFKKMQIVFAFLPGAQSWIAFKCQPLLLCFGSTLLKDKQHLAAPKITALCSSAGPNHNSPEKLRLQTCPSCFQDGGFQQIWPHVHFAIVFSTQPPPRGEVFMCHSGFRPDIPGIWTIINL